jgi:hypothetical protein
MIFVAGDIISICMKQLGEYSNGEYQIPEELSLTLGEYYRTKEDKVKLLKNVATPALTYLNDQLYRKHTKAYNVIQHTSKFCPWNITKKDINAAVDYYFQIGTSFILLVVRTKFARVHFD